MNYIIITEAMIESWRKEKEELEAKLGLIEKRLQALSLFSPENVAKAPPISTPIEESHISHLSTADAIILSLQKSRMPLTAGEIRAALINEGYPQDRWGKVGAYFYSTLKRLADHKKIVKVGNRYKALPVEHAQAKMGNAENDMNLQ